ncbi:hypothetical protein PCK1_000892 [Pneumocystis canis]|nr:hypothetical protein PCK1_000892 [Pneumocystis canis]
MATVDIDKVNDIVCSAKKKLIYATFSKDTSLELSGSSTPSSLNKVNLFASTPPSVIRVIVLLRPLFEWTNWLLSLLTWSSNDPWNSFLLVACWWIFVFNIEILVIFGPWIIILIMPLPRLQQINNEGKRVNEVRIAGDSPQPANISYIWNFGSLLGCCLIIQIITGVTLAMHYTPSVDLAFISVEHIIRDVEYG